MTVRVLAHLIALGLGLGLAVGLSACGRQPSRALIPAAEAGPLNDDFARVAAAVAAGDCPAATRAIAAARAKIDSLPSTTSVRLRARLDEGVARLADQATTECLTAGRSTQTTTVTTSTTPTATTPPPTATTPPPTTPTATTPPPTVPTTTAPAPTATAPAPDTGGVVTP